MSICCVGTDSSFIWVGFRGAGAFLRMLSNESLLLALNSGCLNSQAFLVSRCNLSWGVKVTNIWPVRRLPCFLIILAHFVKVVFVELADETGKVAVFEVFWEDGFGEFFALCHRR